MTKGAFDLRNQGSLGGSINIVTKDYTDLLDVTSAVGETGSSDGRQLKTSANYGFKIGRKGRIVSIQPAAPAE